MGSHAGMSPTYSLRKRASRNGAAVFLTSLTVASVPSASIVSLAPALATAGLPLAGLTLLLGLDRTPDMFRTMTNVVGTMTAATVVAAIEGERRACPGGSQ